MSTIFEVNVEATATPNEVNVTVSNGPKGDPFRYEDFTPDQIEELQAPAIEAAGIANTAADNANDATMGALNAANDAILATDATIEATGEAISATTGAVNATGEAIVATTNANQAAENANSQRGWTPVHIEVTINSVMIVKQLVEYIGGVGDAPTANIGLYVGEGMYVEDPQEALNYKGIPGIDAPTQLGTTAGTVAEGNDERINNGQIAYEYLVSQGLI